MKVQYLSGLGTIAEPSNLDNNNCMFLVGLDPNCNRSTLLDCKDTICNIEIVYTISFVSEVYGEFHP